jgi:hypothetical protein
MNKIERKFGQNIYKRSIQLILQINLTLIETHSMTTFEVFK